MLGCIISSEILHKDLICGLNSPEMFFSPNLGNGLPLSFTTFLGGGRVGGGRVISLYLKF